MSVKRTRAIDAIAGQCIALRLRMVNRAVTNVYDEALRPLGLKASQLNVLVAAGKLGLAQPGKLCDLLEMDTSTLSRNVDRMRAKGWLEVVPGEDARTQPFRLTAHGRKLLEKALPAWERAQERATELLGEEGIALVAKAAQRLGMPASL